VASRADGVLWPTHGPPRYDSVEFVWALLDHRLERERQVLDGITSGVSRITDLVPILYAGVPESLHRAAGRSVLAHVMKLVDDGLVTVVDGGRPGVRSLLAIA
jgi:hypothetical protein